MKLKYPTEILIGSAVFRIIYDKKNRGGSFSYSRDKRKGTIRIGIAHPDLRILDILIHEVKEIIHEEQGTRYRDPSCDENYQFFYGHKEHTDMCSRLAGIISQFIK